MQYRLIDANDAYDVRIRKENGGIFAAIGDNVYEISELVMRENSMVFKIAEQRYRVHFAKDNDKSYIALDGEYYVVERSSHAKRAGTGAGHNVENTVSSPMPGLLVKLAVEVGDLVKAEDTLAIVEAMKMQNELRSPVGGRVKAVNFKEGEQVDALQVIVELESASHE